MSGSANLIQLAMWATTAAAGVASVSVFLEGIKALRAKKRAQRYVRERMRIDTTLASIRQHAVRDALSTEEIETAMKSIEAAIVSMSETDKKFIKQGLHQDSPRGTKRYVNELLTWAEAR
jgi:hypothetical protein